MINTTIVVNKNSRIIEEFCKKFHKIVEEINEKIKQGYNPKFIKIA